MTGRHDDLDAVLTQLDTLIDGRSALSDAYGAALNSSGCGGAITRDAAPHWRDVARHLRRGARLAEQLAAGHTTDNPAPVVRDRQGGQYRLDIMRDADPDTPLGVVYFDAARGVDPIEQARHLLTTHERPDYGDLYIHDSAGAAVYYDIVTTGDQDGPR